MAYEKVTESCGYQGHICSNSVQFISRYRNCNDYCLRGSRISVHDDGTVHSYPTPNADQIKAIRMYEIQKYADYVKWHVEFKAKHQNDASIELQPFGFPEVLTVVG